MAAPLPLAKFEVLFDELVGIARGVGHFDDLKKSGEYERLMASYELYARQEAHFASVLKALLNAMVGDVQQMERWLKNIAALGYKREAAFERLQCFSILGFASQACEVASEVYRDPGTANFCDISAHVATSGGFSLVKAALQCANDNKQVIKMTERLILFRDASTVLEQMGAPDNVVTLVYDVVGALLREQRLLWVGGGPKVFFFPKEDGGPSFHADFHLAVNVQRAAELTWELTERLVAQDLDRYPVTVSFIGTLEG